MHGVVTSYKKQDCKGIITTNDGKEYFITRYSIDGLPVPERDDIVSFEVDGDKAIEVIPLVSKFFVRRALKKEGLELVEGKDPLGNRAYMIVDDSDWKKNYEHYYTLTEAAKYAGVKLD